MSSSYDDEDGGRPSKKVRLETDFSLYFWNDNFLTETEIWKQNGSISYIVQSSLSANFTIYLCFWLYLRTGKRNYFFQEPSTKLTLCFMGGGGR